MDEQLNKKTLDELAEFKEEEVVPAAPSAESADLDSEESDQAEEQGNISPSLRTLKTLIDGSTTFFRANQFDVYATITTTAGVVHVKIYSRIFKMYLSGIALSNSIMPTDTTLNAVINWIEYETVNAENNIEEVHYRKGFDKDGNLWILRSTDPMEYIKVTTEGYESQLTDCPIKIVVNETAKELPLPLPKKQDGDLNLINKYVNLEPSKLPLLHSLLTCFYVLKNEFPITLAQGQHNTGKSTMIKVIYSLVDPNESRLRGMVAEKREMYTAAGKTHLFGMDNLKVIPTWWSEIVCQIATGAEVEYRRHYSNDETIVIRVCNPVIIGSIHPVSTETDFISRAVLLPTQEISSTDRQTNEVFWDSFKNDSRTIFTGLLNAISHVLKNRSSTNTDNLSRITDFHILGRTLNSHGLNWEIDFDTAMGGSIEETNEQLVEENPIAQLLIMQLNASGLTSLSYKTAKWNVVLQSVDDNLNQEEQKFLQEQTKDYEIRYLGRAFARIVEPLMHMGYKFTKKKMNDGSYWKIEHIPNSDATHATHATDRAEHIPSDSGKSGKSGVKLNRQDYTGTIFEPKDNKNG